MEVFGGAFWRGLEFEDREHDDDEGYCCHEEAEDDVPCCFDARFAGGEAAGVYAADGPVADYQCDVGHGVEDGVGHGCEEGEGAARGDCAVDLEDC